jgi:uncharacterized protein (TIGR03503 family)
MGKINNKWGHLVFTLTLLFILPATAFQDDVPKVKYYESDNVTNQVPYFDNRFQIDPHIKDLKLIFYRRSGSQPIILVRPDGSKLKINNLPEDGSIEWFDERTFDLIKMKNPMAGPWQAIGQVLPGSQILVVSEIKIEVDPLPEIILSGETLKITGRLLNGKEALDDPLFRPVVNLDVDFFSTNNSDYDNFGAEPIKLNSFRDDGYDFDEKAGDGVYTGEFVLNFAPGEWLPIYYIKMPLVKRELQQKPIILRDVPVKPIVRASDELGKNHVMTFPIDPTFVDPHSIILQGKIMFPDKQEELFTVLAEESDSRVKEFEYAEAGIHRLTINVFGETTSGREFVLALPEFVFNAEDKNGLLISALDSEGNEIFVPRKTAAEILAEKEAERAAALAEQQARKLAEEEEAQKQMWIMIGVGNGVVIFVALAIFGFLAWRKKKALKVDEEV